MRKGLNKDDNVDYDNYNERTIIKIISIITYNDNHIIIIVIVIRYYDRYFIKYGCISIKV